MSNPNKKKPRSRYKRDQQNPRPGKFQPKGDAEIIQWVHECRYLTRPLLELLTDRKGTSLKNRLRFLYDNGYLWKVQFSRNYLATGSTPDIYVIDKKGRDVYFEITGKKADHSPKRNQNKDPQLEHTLWMNTIRATITNACKHHPDLELITWIRSGERSRDKVKIKGETKIIAPDGFFVIKKPNGRVSAFFLEADRSSENLKTFTEKLKRYYAYYWSIRKELDRQKGKAKKKVSNRFNISGFRVLTVIENDLSWQKMRSKDRFSDLIQSGYQASEDKGFRGFWFTTKERFSIEKPESILENIWEISHPAELNKLHSIIE